MKSHFAFTSLYLFCEGDSSLRKWKLSHNLLTPMPMDGQVKFVVHRNVLEPHSKQQKIKRGFENVK